MTELLLRKRLSVLIRGGILYIKYNTYRLQLYLDYPWCLEVCKWVYTPQGVEQVMDVTMVTGLSGVIICKAL